MRIGNLKSVKSWLLGHPTAGDRLWGREALAISEMEIQLFYARASLNGHKNEAVEAIDALQAAVIISVSSGEISEAPSAIILHEPPDQPFMVDELVDGMVSLRPARRHACLLALELRQTPEAVSNLRWTEVKKMKQLSGMARDILLVAGKTRHMALPYVFWEWATPTIATPLLELQWSVERAFGCTWPELVQRYGRMIMINRDAEVVNFMALVEQQGDRL